jgi:hypothetical protein
VYTVRDPPFRRWRTGTLSEHMSLSDLRGAILLVRAPTWIRGKRQLLDTTGKIRLSLVPLSLLSCIYFQHLISALKFPYSSSL